MAKTGRVKSGLELSPLHAAHFEQVKLRGPRATCFFNNKGGVGKTTLVANLGAELALSFGAKVLVIDADPQCNLSQYVLSSDESIETYNSDNPLSIYSVIRPLSLGKGYGGDLPVRKSENFGFDIIVGDPRLALQEDLLAGDWRDARGGGMRGLRTTFVFANLVATAKSQSYDFIFFDMGPSLGAINRSILLAMDYFVVPMSIDIFSSWAIKNIGQTVSVWQKELSTGLLLAEDPSEIPFSSERPNLKFIGYVTQQHKERAQDADIKELSIEEILGIDSENDIESSSKEVQESEDHHTKSADDSEDEDFEPAEIEVIKQKRKRLVQAYEDINTKFPREISQNLSKFYDESHLNPHLGSIRHLGSLAPMSQSQHRPMIGIKGKGSYTQLRKQAREIYRDIAVRYLENAGKN